MNNYARARVLLALSLLLSFFSLAQAQDGEVALGWNPSPSKTTTGYEVFYGLESGDYTSNWDAGPIRSATVTGLTPGLTYYFAISAYDANGNFSAFSNEVTNRVPVPPVITTQPLTQADIVNMPAAVAVGAFGDPPLAYQWWNGSIPVAGGSSSSLSWSKIGTYNAGNYTVIISNPYGSVTSSVANLTVLIPASITKQPASESVVAGAPASFSATAAGTAPLSLQWYCGTTAIAGATNSSLAWAGAAISNAGNYSFVVSNVVCAVTSSVTLTVTPSSLFAPVAGTYYGLFFPTNADGTPAISEATSGFLGNCVVATNSAFSAKIFIGGQSYSWSGNFNTSGNHGASIPHSGLSAFLQLDLTNGTQQMTGTICSNASSNVWTAPLVAYLTTNAYPQLNGVSLIVSPGSSPDSPTGNGLATGLVINSVLTLSGILGDASIFSQTVPISVNGEVPIYVSLYNNGGLLEGWLNLNSGAVTGSLTWIRPSGVLVPFGFPNGFDTLVNVTGTTLGQ